MGCQTFKIKRGERCIINLTCTSTGSPIDWSNVRVRVSLRECAEGPVVTQFDTEGGDNGWRWRRVLIWGSRVRWWLNRPADAHGPLGGIRGEDVPDLDTEIADLLVLVFR